MIRDGVGLALCLDSKGWAFQRFNLIYWCHFAPARAAGEGARSNVRGCSVADVKPWYLSLGVWASLVTLAASVLRLFRVEIDPTIQRDAPEWLLSAATLAGGAGALWGRWRASRRIGAARLPSPPAALLLFALPAAALVGGCSALQAIQGPGGAYVAGDRATYDAVAPEYAAYVAADPALAPDQKDRRTRTLQTWRMRVEAAERAGGDSGDANPLAGPTE